MTWIWTTDGTANNSVNLAPATGAVALWAWVSLLKQAGWTQVDSSDGTTRGASQVTSGASGAGGLGNTSAYIILRDPAGVREICIQRGTTNLLWRAKWSHSARFTGGSPSATQTASATDEQIINAVGGGTNASPTYTTIFSADNGYKFHCGADNAAPYGWWWQALDNGGAANTRRGWYMPMLSGSYPSGEAAPYIVDFGGTSTPFGTANIWGSGYYKKGLAGEAWVAFYVLVYYSNRATAQQAPSGGSAVVNPISGNDDALQVPCMRDFGLSSPGWKGILDPEQFIITFVSRASGNGLKDAGATKEWMRINATTIGGGCRWPVGVALTT